MSLAPGTRLGPYEITAVLGAGGMGEVYRATDNNLKRQVALKVLPAAVAGDADRLARFQREAEVLAALNHPNIAAIYGLEKTPGFTALVMELVEGEDLSTLIDRGHPEAENVSSKPRESVSAAGRGGGAPRNSRKDGGLPLDDALTIAKQIADALEAAHEQGIVHRDLKPANVKVRADGTVKVLDFGLAKAVQGDGSRLREQDPSPSSLANSPTMTSPLQTQVGMILGTAAYMAPEQARGKSVDKRADIWAFGCVLFELLTGRRAFAGDEVTDVIAAVITREPDLAALPPATPANVRAVLARCFVKDPRERLRDIGDARLLLAERAEPVVVASARRSVLVPILAGGLAVALLLLGVTLLRPRAPADLEPVRLTMVFPEDGQPQRGQPLPSMALSPDGRTFVYSAVGPEGTQLWMRDLNDFSAKPIPGTGPGKRKGGSGAPLARQAFFSPDGKSIGYVAGNLIKTMPVAAGTASDVCEVFDGVTGATWTDQSEIVFAASTGKHGLWRVPAGGGTPVKVADGEFYFPDALPGGRAVVVTVPNDRAQRSSSELTLAAVTLATGAVTKVLDGGTFARYVPTGHLVFGRDFALVASTFDPTTFAVGEARTPVVTDFWMDPTFQSGNYAVSASGTLVYSPGAATDFERTLVAIDGDGSRTLIPDRRYFASARMSPRGRYVAVMERAWEDRILVVDTVRGTSARLTSTVHVSESNPVWSPDGRQVAFGTKAGISVAPLDQTVLPTKIYASDSRPVPTSFSGDGLSVIFEVRQEDTGWDLMIASLGPEHTVRPLLQTPADEREGVVAPDGRSIAYQSNRTGTAEVWVSDFPSMQNAVQVSTNGGATPRWAPDSRRLYFRKARVIMADVSRRSAGDIPHPTAGLNFPAPYPTAFIDVMPDGRFLAIDGPRVGEGRELHVIVNWSSELKAKVGR